MLRLTPSGRLFTLSRNGRWFGEWNDSGNTSQLGGGYRSVLLSYMGSKDGPIGTRQFSPALDYIEAGGGVNGIVVVSSRIGLRNGYNRSPSVRLDTNYVAKAGDVILVNCTCGSQARPINVTGPWTNVLGGNTNLDNGRQSSSMIYHVVTSAEEQAGTNSWSLPNYYGGNEFGFINSLAIRGLDPNTPINAFATGMSATNVTPHTMPALPAVGLNNRSLVLSFMNRDGHDFNGAYRIANTPNGWTQIAAIGNGGTPSAPWNGNLDTGSLAVYQRSALTQSGVPVTATNVAPNAADAYVAFTVALNVKPNT